MRNKGFYIKAVIATGQNVQDTRVNFKKGCNLVFGRSNCGKSHILDIIDFLLGRRKNPKEVKEGKGYDTFYLEIATYQDENIYTIKRKRNGRSVLVKPVAYNDFNTDVIGESYAVSSTSKKKMPSLSSFLLRLNGFDSDYELKCNITAKRVLSFSLLRHLFLANESHVISDKPLFNASESDTEFTVEKSLIFLLTTGVDDSSFVPETKKEIQRATINGKLALIEDIIKNKKTELEKIGEAGRADFSDNAFYERYKHVFEDTTRSLNRTLARIRHLEGQQSELLSRKLFLKTFVERLRLLKEHYDVDLTRYDFIFQGYQLFEALADDSLCPVCKSHIQSTQLHPDFASSIKSEVTQLYKRKREVDEMIDKQTSELTIVSATLSSTINEINGLTEKGKTIYLAIEDVRETLQRYQSNIESNTRHATLIKEIEELITNRSKLEDELKSIAKKKSTYTRISNIKEEFCNSLESKLIDWHIKDVSPIEFDEKSFDFMIGGKGRLTCGKGERGVTCTAILMTLVEFCIKNDMPFTRTLIVDSPITAHFTSETSHPEEITQKSFFKYCNENINDYQLIIIDNKSPEQDERVLLKNINYIGFDSSDRAGFYPV